MKNTIKILIFSIISITTLTLAGCSTQEENTPVKPAVQSLDQTIYLRARKAYLARNYKTAAALLDPIAEKGNANAQYTLGYLYYYGKGVKRSLKQAMGWFNKAANQNHQRAINALSTINEAIKKKPVAARPVTNNTPAKVIDLRTKKASVPAQSNPAPTPTAPVVLPTSVPVYKGAAIKIISPEPKPVHTPVIIPAQKPVPPPPLKLAKQKTKPIPAVSDSQLQLEEKGRQWIMNQPPEHYTIQLASSSRVNSALNFIKNAALDGVFLFRYTDKKGQVRLNVIHGSIFSFTNAKKKLKRLHQRGFKNAWIRGIGPIQKIISQP